MAVSEGTSGVVHVMYGGVAAWLVGIAQVKQVSTYVVCSSLS
jgi:hypothetical protein